MSGQYWKNGKPQACLDAGDRAIQYGDGVFETIRVRERQPQYLSRHITRLTEGCNRLLIASVPWQLLENEILELAARQDDAIMKVILSRGSGGRGYQFDTSVEATRLIGLYPVAGIETARSKTGIRTRVCSLRLAQQPILAGIKHLNRLEQVLARAEWDDPGIHEGLLLDTSGQLIEGTMSNLFLVRDNALVTPDLSLCGVAGIMRSIIIDLAREQGVDVTIKAMTLADVKSAQELFICNSLIGIWPITSIDGIRDLAVGPVTKKLVLTLATHSDSSNGHWYA